MPIPSVVIEPASSNEGDDDRDTDIISPTNISDNIVTSESIKHMSASGGTSGYPDDFLYKVLLFSKYNHCSSVCLRKLTNPDWRENPLTLTLYLPAGGDYAWLWSSKFWWAGPEKRRCGFGCSHGLSWRSGQRFRTIFKLQATLFMFLYIKSYLGKWCLIVTFLIQDAGWLTGIKESDWSTLGLGAQRGLFPENFTQHLQ